MNWKTLALSFFSLFIFHLSIAQKLTYRQGELIVQLQDQQRAKTFLQEKKIGFRVEKQLSSSLNIS